MTIRAHSNKFQKYFQKSIFDKSNILYCYQLHMCMVINKCLLIGLKVIKGPFPVQMWKFSFLQYGTWCTGSTIGPDHLWTGYMILSRSHRGHRGQQYKKSLFLCTCHMTCSLVGYVVFCSSFFYREHFILLYGTLSWEVSQDKNNMIFSSISSTVIFFL